MVRTLHFITHEMECYHLYANLLKWLHTLGMDSVGISAEVITFLSGSVLCSYGVLFGWRCVFDGSYCLLVLVEEKVVYTLKQTTQYKDFN